MNDHLVHPQLITNETKVPRKEVPAFCKLTVTPDLTSGLQIILTICELHSLVSSHSLCNWLSYYVFPFQGPQISYLRWRPWAHMVLKKEIMPDLDKFCIWLRFARWGDFQPTFPSYSFLKGINSLHIVSLYCLTGPLVSLCLFLLQSSWWDWHWHWHLTSNISKACGSWIFVSDGIPSAARNRKESGNPDPMGFITK